MRCQIGQPGEVLRMSGSLRISVIIPCFNRTRELEKTLTAFSTQTLPADQFEVIVVDDGSTDGLAETVRRISVPYPLKIIWQPNRGPGSARNRGAREARSNLFIFLDADMIPALDLIDQYLQAHTRYPDAILIGRHLPWPESLVSPLDRAFPYVFDLGPEPIETRFYHLASGNMALGRQTFATLGGFDENLRMTEDTDLGYRAHLQGIQIVYIPTAIGYHNHSRTLVQLCQQQQCSSWWQAQLVHKYPELRGQIPAYQEVEPIHLGDSPYLLIRKVARRLLAVFPVRCALLAMTRFLGHLGVPPWVLRFFYYKLLTSYRLIGYRQGLKNRTPLVAQ